VWMLGGRGWRFVVGSAVVAGSANLWNLLDVRPGRSLKFFLPAGIGLAAALSGPFSVVFVVASAGAAPALAADLLERAMLGDSGANVLGFLVGVGTFLALRTPWLWLLMAGLVALHALADTITLSRLIDSTPPLRWFDRLGRRKFATTT
jgi:UDP-GlcNAc:undecaprenyl-phosphate/decaprenyl-phosphate GlcNAc-1-phosphate transferase